MPSWDEVQAKMDKQDLERAEQERIREEARKEQERLAEILRQKRLEEERKREEERIKLENIQKMKDYFIMLKERNLAKYIGNVNHMKIKNKHMRA